MIKFVKKFITQYGFFYSIKIIAFEIFFFRLNKELIFNFASKKFDNRNIEYVPTPYYLLYLIKKNLPNVNKFDLIDFGCGRGRVYNFFKNYINFYLGIDIISEFKEIFKTRYKFINLDCRNIYELKKKINNLKNRKILYFFKPFDDNLIFKILRNLMQQNDIAVVINLDNHDKIKNYKIIFSKKFKDKKKTIYIISK